MITKNSFKYFKILPENIKLAVMYYGRFPLNSRWVEDILHERGIYLCHETVRFWWNHFIPLLAKEIRHHRAGHHSNGVGTLMKFSSKINGERYYLWWAIDHEGKRCFKASRSPCRIKNIKKIAFHA